jgi:serine/threonine-protein kinase
MEAPSATLSAGSTLDRYELLCPLAEGGMATVWLARMQGKRGFEKLVAIKTIKAELVDDPRFEEMFLDEARIASGITHPNVAQIIDLGEKDGVLYLVMEWVDGESLAKVRKFAVKARVRLPLGLTLRIIADACAGLHAAHELKGPDGELLGVVHRDVSPQNILISTAGAVKVIDFGIAKAQNRLGSRTRTGVVKGKVQYMAPEQAQGDAHDRRIDVWALGVCLYELVTDRLPFDGDNPLEVLSHITSDEAPPIDGDVPLSVRGIIFKALSRNPEERFATAAAMRRAIESALSQLALDNSTEDLAAFVDAHMPHRATERREIVSRALKAAEARSQGSVDAFTGTVEVPGTTRGSATRADRVGAPQGTPASSPQLLPRGTQPLVPKLSARALLEEEPRSRAPLWIVLALVAVGSGGFVLWRSNPSFWSSLQEPSVAPARPTEDAQPAAPAPKEESASSAPSAVEAAPATPDAPSASQAPIAAASSSAPETPAASAADSATTPRKPPHKHSWPSGAPEPSAPPRNADWLPKQSELPTIAPPSSGSN